MALRDEVMDLVRDMDGDVEAAVVEGSNDRKALERAGFTGKIYTCSENTDGVVSLGRTIARESESVSVLTDFDKEGRKLCGKLQDILPERRIHRIWRKKMGKLLTVNGRRDVESINNILDT